MIRHKTIFLLTLICIFLVCSSASAQNVISANAGTISYIDGIAYLDNGQVRVTKGIYFQMENGQRLKTLKGWAEVVLTPGAYLRLGENSSAKMEQNRISE